MNIEDHYINRNGKQFVLYSGLLGLAHEKGLQSIEEEVLQMPTEENGRFAVCRATITTTNGEVFQGLGDASPESVARNIVVHLLRMASTRSKARALRDLSNIGVTALEEISDGDNSSTTSGGATGESQSQNSKASGSKGNTTASGTSDNPEPQKITDSQKRQIRKVSEELFPSVEDMENHKSVTVDSLTVAEANELLKTLNTMKQQKTEA